MTRKSAVSRNEWAGLIGVAILWIALGVIVAACGGSCRIGPGRWAGD